MLKQANAEERENLEQYEITYLLKSEDVAPVLSLVKKISESEEESRPLQKVQLEYPIKKENQAFIGSIKFVAEREGLAKLNKELGLDAGILRFIITKRKTVKTRNIETEDNRKENRRRAGPEVVSRRRKDDETSNVLTNEALEKKIEEILK